VPVDAPLRLGISKGNRTEIMNCVGKRPLTRKMMGQGTRRT
jgi:hypothetical protein